MTADFEKAIAERSPRGETERVLRKMWRGKATPELDADRASKVVVGDRQWSFVLTREAADGWERLGSSDMTVAVLVYEQPGAAAPFVQREIAVRPGKRQLVVEVRENGVPRWTGEGFVNRGGDLEFKVQIDRESGRKAGMMAGQVSRDGELRLTEARLPRPTRARKPELIAEEKA